MTWEIFVGLTTLLTAFLSIMSVVVKVNRALVSLEGAVKQMTSTLEKQQRKNSSFSNQLLDHEKRLIRLEATRQGQEEQKEEA